MRLVFVAVVPTAGEKSTPAPKVPTGRYALNLHSELVPVVDLPQPVDDGQLIYVTETELDGETWYRLRLGFFETEADAEAALDEWLEEYPSAWLVRVGPKERARAGLTPAVASLTN